MRKFFLLCDTVDDSGVSKQRHDDGDTTDLRLEMALESLWIVCAHEKSKQLRTTENKRACALYS